MIHCRWNRSPLALGAKRSGGMRRTPNASRGSAKFGNSRSIWSAAYSAAFGFAAACLSGATAAHAMEPWENALTVMSLPAGVTELNVTNCVKVILTGLQSNAVVKGIVFMPGATDELYFFRRAKATLTNSAPAMLDGVNALRNQ